MLILYLSFLDVFPIQYFQDILLIIIYFQPFLIYYSAIFEYDLFIIFAQKNSKCIILGTNVQN